MCRCCADADHMLMLVAIIIIQVRYIDPTLATFYYFNLGECSCYAHPSYFHICVLFRRVLYYTILYVRRPPRLNPYVGYAATSSH